MYTQISTNLITIYFNVSNRVDPHTMYRRNSGIWIDPRIVRIGKNSSEISCQTSQNFQPHYSPAVSLSSNFTQTCKPSENSFH